MHKDLICIKIFDNFTVNFERAFRRFFTASLFAKELKKTHYGLRETGSFTESKNQDLKKISYTKN